jgi:hypothetical protein
MQTGEVIFVSIFIDIVSTKQLNRLQLNLVLVFYTDNYLFYLTWFRWSNGQWHYINQRPDFKIILNVYHRTNERYMIDVTNLFTVYDFWLKYFSLIYV